MALHVCIPTVTHELFSDQEKTTEQHAQHEALRRQREEKIRMQAQYKQDTSTAAKGISELVAKKFVGARNDATHEANSKDVEAVAHAALVLQHDFSQPHAFSQKKSIDKRQNIRSQRAVNDPKLTMHLATTEAIRRAAHGQSVT